MLNTYWVFLVLIWTPKAIYFFCNTFLADIANQNILLQINNVLMFMEYHSSALWKMAILNLRKYWEQNCQCCKSMKWKQSWCHDLNDTGNVGLHCRFISSAANIDAKYWTAPLSNLVEKTFNWSIWHLTVQNNQFRCKRKIFWIFSKIRFFWRKKLMSIFPGYWRQCWKYCLLLPSWYLLPPILLSCYYMLCLFDRCNYLDFHTLVYSDNISVFLYIYSEGVWLFASQDIRLQCEIV